MIRAVAVVLAVTAVGCVRSEETRVKNNVETMQREQTADKLLARGKAFASVGDLTRAEQYLAAALDAGGDPRKVLPPLISVCVDGKRYRVAIDYAEPHLKAHPQETKLRFLVGTLYLAVGDATAARARFDEVVATDPADGEAHYALGVVLRDSEKDYVGADKHFREYLRLEPKGSHADDARASLLRSVH